MEIALNEFLSKLEELEFDTQPDEIKELFIEFVSNIPLVLNIINPNRKRAKDLPRDEKGRIIVDITNPHILEDMDYFRPAAIFFLEHKCYTKLRPNKNPNSDYGKWIREEVRRCREGYVRESDGEWIPGDYYFFLNYCPMLLSEKEDKNSKKANRVMSFPRIWDGHYLKFHYLWQARLNGKHALELASRQKGKAHPYSQIVYTPDGKKTWGDIKIGDLLFGDDGKTTKVIDIPFDLKISIYEVGLSDGRTLQCSLDHLFKVRDSRKKKENLLKVLSLRDILNSDYYHLRKNSKYEAYYSIPNHLGVDFNSRKVLMDPYTLGLALGDGCFRTNYVNTLMFTSRDEDIETYKRKVPYNIWKIKGNYNYRIGILQIKSILEQYNLYKKGSSDKFIPEDYIFNTRKVRMLVLRGLLDTDGTVNNNGVPMLTTTSEQLAKDVILLCRSLGYNTRMFKKLGKYQGKVYKTTYNITILTNDKIFTLERKLKKLTDFSSNNSRAKKDWTHIVSIKYSHEENAKCVTVDNSTHCYLIGDFVTTHNSFCAASLLTRRFGLGESDKVNEKVTCYATAAEKGYLVKGDQTLDKFQYNIDFLAQNTELPYRDKLINTILNMQWVAGYKDLDTETRMGTLNAVMGITSKDDESKLRGTRGVLYIIEEAGSFPRLLELWNNLLPSVQDGDDVYGMLFAFGTAGDSQSDFRAMAEMMYHPKGYDVYQLDNVYDLFGKAGKHFAFFFPGYMNYAGCYDSNGNSDVTKAIMEILKKRFVTRHSSTDINTITKKIAEIPITPQEAVMKTTGNIFPTTQLTERLSELDSNPNIFDDVYTGDLVLTSSGKVEFRPTNEPPIREYPLKDNTAKGCFEIFQMPETDSNGNVKPYRYIASLDPYNNDLAESSSLGSFFVLDLLQDKIVCEYTGRTPYLDDFFEKVRLGCIFYNAKCLYESNIRGAFSYFSKTNSLHLLADTPEYLRDKQIIKYSAFGSSSKGVTATKAVNLFADNLTRDWLLKPILVVKGEGENVVEYTVPNLYFIKNRALLKELISYNPYLNFDRCVFLNTQIATKNGTKVILDIQIGDYVLSADGQYNQVYSTLSNIFIGNKYSLRALGDYRVLECTDNHPILTCQKQGCRGENWMKNRNNLTIPAYKRADQLNKNDLVLIPKRLNLGTTDIPEDLLYLLGWYIADGTVNLRQNKVSFFLQEDLYCIGLELKNILNKYFKRNKTYHAPRKTKRGTTVSGYWAKESSEAKLKHCRDLFNGKVKQMWIVSIHSRELKEFLIKHGGGPKHKTISEDLYNCKNILPLLRGYFEGDGHYRCKVRCDGSERNTLEVNTIYEDLALKIRQLLLDNDLWCVIRKVKPRNSKCLPLYNITLTNQYALPIINKSLKFSHTIALHKKTVRENFIKTSLGYWVKLKKLEFTPITDVTYNISVMNNPSYIANGITTHNCRSLGLLMIYREEKMILYLGNISNAEKEPEIETDDFFYNNFESKFGNTTALIDKEW